MHRRTAIRNVLIITTGAAFLPVACRNHDKAVIPEKNSLLSSGEQDMLAKLAETIIPQTVNFPGAEDLKCHEFVLRMVNDCTSPEEQEKFTGGLKEFDKLCQRKFGKNFSSCTASQRNLFLTDIENKKGIQDDVLKFYETVKRCTLQGFTSSKQYMQDIKKYVMVPGPAFKGCVPVKKS